MRKWIEQVATFECLTCLLLIVLIGTVISTVAQSGVVLDLDAPEDMAESTAAAAAAPLEAPPARRSHMPADLALPSQ